MEWISYIPFSFVHRIVLKNCSNTQMVGLNQAARVCVCVCANISVIYIVILHDSAPEVIY